MPAFETRPDLNRFFDFLHSPVGDNLKGLLTVLKTLGLTELGLRVVRLSTAAAGPVLRPPTVFFRDAVGEVTKVAFPANSEEGFQYPFTFGELLFGAAWVAGYTPRLYDRPVDPRTNDGVAAVLAFVPFPDAARAAEPVDSEVLRRAARVGPHATPAGRLPRGLPLREWVDQFETGYGVPVRAAGPLLDLPVVLSFPGAVGLADVLDAAANYLGAVWDWGQGGVSIRAARGGGCDDRLSRR